MKKFTTKMSVILCVLFFGISFNFSVSGQNKETVTPVKKGIFEKTHQKNKLANSNLKTEAMPQFYKSTNDTYPQEIHHYYWDVTTIWMADYNKYVSYDNHANILTEMYTNANTGDTTEQYVNTYDAHGRQTKRVHQLWITGSWENDQQEYWEYDDFDNMTIHLFYYWQGGSWYPNAGEKYVYTYDINNNITEKIQQNWIHSSSVWENLTKYMYSYDINGYLIERIYQYWNGSSQIWITSSKYTYIANASGVVFERLLQGWDNVNAVWVDSEKHINIVWHNWTGDFDESDIESYTALHYSNGFWENYFRINITYDAFGGSVKIRESWFNSNWINSYRETQSYDEHGNFLGWQTEYWINNVWIIDMGSKYFLTYSGNDLTQSIMQEWDHVWQQWENQTKEEYSDFVTIEGIDENAILSASINLYPNPARGILNLEVKNMDKEDLSIEIVNLNGQVIFSKQFNNTGQLVNKIDVSNYSKGIYFVKVKNANELKVGKIIIQ